LHAAIIPDRLANALLRFGDTNLAQFSILPGSALIQGFMQLPLGAAAIRLAALAGTFRQSAAKEPSTGGELHDLGTEVALDGGKLGPAEGLAHLLYQRQPD